MKLSLAEPKILIDSISVISELVNEVRFKVDTDKIELVAMDPANVAMVVFTLLSSAFVEYKVAEKEEIAINLDSFKQILRRVKPNDVLNIELDKEESKLKINVKGESNRTFKLGLIDITEREQKVPKLDFLSELNISSLIFNEAIEDMGIISESVSFSVDKEKFVIESEGKVNHAKVEINHGNDTQIKLKGDNVKSKYSIEYLKKMVKACKLSDEVNLKLSKDYPLQLGFRVKDKLDLSFVLAPRVSND